MQKINRGDLAELTIGACVLAFPIAVTEEVWKLSEHLPLFNILMIAVLSCLFLSIFVYFIHGKGESEDNYHFDFKRVLITYGLTLLVCACILTMLDKLPLFADTATALKRIILIAFPASFSATVVDSLR